jgi:hypothetical protein
VDVPTALLSDLTELANGVGLDAGPLQVPLKALVGELRAAVGSYRGLQLTIVRDGQPVTLTDVSGPDEDGSITTSLRVPLSLLGPSYDGGSRVVLYASGAGSLIDLATDLGHVLKSATIAADAPDRDGAVRDGDGWAGPAHVRSPMLRLDADVPPNPVVSGLIGLSEMSAVDHAVGIMIERGHHPDVAYDALIEQAAAEGVETHVYAVQMLGCLRP